MSRSRSASRSPFLACREDAFSNDLINNRGLRPVVQFFTGRVKSLPHDASGFIVENATHALAFTARRTKTGARAMHQDLNSYHEASLIRRGGRNLNARGKLTGIKDASPKRLEFDRGGESIIMEWKPIFTAPFERDVELAVIENNEAHALAFPCRSVHGAWVDAKTKKLIAVFPTHWREWPQRRTAVHLSDCVLGPRN
jgi:hypothetical protein